MSWMRLHELKFRNVEGKMLQQEDVIDLFMGGLC